MCRAARAQVALFLLACGDGALRVPDRPDAARRPGMRGDRRADGGATSAGPYRDGAAGDGANARDGPPARDGAVPHDGAVPRDAGADAAPDASGCLPASVVASVAACAGEVTRGRSWSPSISADGRRVAFVSEAGLFTDLVLVRDLGGGTMTVPAYGRLSSAPVISANGRTVAFTRRASSLAADRSVPPALFTYDTESGAVTRIDEGDRYRWGSDDYAVSGDGRKLAYTPHTPPGAWASLVLRDLDTGEEAEVSLWWRHAEQAAVSWDGRYVAYVGDDDVRVRDMESDTEEIASVTVDGFPSGGWWPEEEGPMNLLPSISADGSRVAFASLAPDLVPPDLPDGAGSGGWDVFVRDLAAGETRIVSVDPDGNPLGSTLYLRAQIAPDGSAVLLASARDEEDGSAIWAEREDCDHYDLPLRLWVRRIDAGETVPVEVGGGATMGCGVWPPPASLSDGGRLVAFATRDALVAGDGNGVSDVVVRDLQTGEAVLASAPDPAADAGPLQPDGASGLAVLADGMVAFASDAANLACDEDGAGAGAGIFVRELRGGGGVRLALHPAPAPPLVLLGDLAASADGRAIAWTVLGGEACAVFVHDRDARTTSCVHPAADGLPDWYAAGWGVALSGDGRTVAYRTGAGGRVLVRDAGSGAVIREIAAGDTPAIALDGAGARLALATGAALAPGDDGRSDLYVVQVDTGEATRVAPAPDGLSRRPALTADGRTVAFLSAARDLVPGDGDDRVDLFLRDLDGGGLRRVPLGMLPPVEVGHRWMSADGTRIAFTSWEDGLTEEDANGMADAFVHDLGASVTIRVGRSPSGEPARAPIHAAGIAPDGRSVALQSEDPGLAGGADGVFVQRVVVAPVCP